MSTVVDVVKTRQAFLSLFSAIGFFLATSGKVSQDQWGLWTEQMGRIFDAGMIIFGAVSILVPSIKAALKSLKKETPV